MSIIAIGYFAVRPVVGGAMQSSRRRAVLRRLVGLFTQARTEAVGQGRLVRVVCDTQEGALWAEVQVDPAVDRSEFEGLSIMGREGFQLPDDFVIVQLMIAGMDASSPGTGEIYFYADGTTDGLALTMEGPGGQEVTIEVLPTTGKVILNV